MKIEVAKADLESAIQITGIAIAGGDDGDVKTHYIFRGQEGKVDILASNGMRLCASAPIHGAKVDEEDFTFSVPGWRLRQFVNAVDDEAITLEHSDGVTKLASRRGTGRTGALDVQNFPFWDDMLKEATLIAKVATTRLYSVLSYAKNFVSTEETRMPHLVAVSAQNGEIRSTDTVGICIVSVPGLEDSKLQVNGKDVSSVLSFLGLKGSDTIEVLEHDRCLFFRREDGSTFGVTRWPNDFPLLKLDKNQPDKCWFSVSTADLAAAIKFLSAFAAKDDLRLRFRFDVPNEKVVLSMESASGSEDQDELSVPLVEHEDIALMAEEGYEHFTLKHDLVTTVASFFGQETIRFGVGWAPKNGYVTIRHDLDGDEYFTLIVWHRKK